MRPFLALAPLLFFSPPSSGDSFTALCQSPWKDVAAPDNGSGRCCSTGGDAFMCNMHPGHQHEGVVYEYLRFYDGASKKPRVEIAWRAYPNPGMAARTKPPALARLMLSPTAEGFELTAESKAACTPPTPGAKEVCSNAGRWTMKNGIPSRP